MGWSGALLSPSGDMIDFQPIDLIADWPPLATMDLVLIRNVLIYFENDAKKQILARIAGLLPTDGYLILGASRTPLFSQATLRASRYGSMRCLHAETQRRPGAHSVRESFASSSASGLKITKDCIIIWESLFGLAASMRHTPAQGRSVMENGDVDKLREAVETIWSTMLGLELAPGQPMGDQSIQRGFLTGCIQITGAWNGAVTVDCAGGLAQSDCRHHVWHRNR